MSERLEKVENEPKAKHGGKREGSGRKPLIDKDEIDRVNLLISQHGLEPDPKDKQKRTRILRLMDELYELGTKGKKKNLAAIKEYLDRQIGKSKEHVEHTGNLPFNITITQKK